MDDLHDDYDADDFDYGPDLEPEFDFDFDSEPLNSFD